MAPCLTFLFLRFHNSVKVSVLVPWGSLKRYVLLSGWFSSLCCLVVYYFCFGLWLCSDVRGFSSGRGEKERI